MKKPFQSVTLIAYGSKKIGVYDDREGGKPLQDLHDRLKAHHIHSRLLYADSAHSKITGLMIEDGKTTHHIAHFQELGGTVEQAKSQEPPSKTL